jgi:hypothetical protein
MKVRRITHPRWVAPEVGVWVGMTRVCVRVCVAVCVCVCVCVSRQHWQSGAFAAQGCARRSRRAVLKTHRRLPTAARSCCTTTT